MSGHDHFGAFVQQHENNPAFAAYHSEEFEEQDFEERSIHADDQTVVSEITTLSSADLFRGPLYKNPRDLHTSISDLEVSKLFSRPPRLTEIDEGSSMEPSSVATVATMRTEIPAREGRKTEDNMINGRSSEGDSNSTETKVIDTPSSDSVNAAKDVRTEKQSATTMSSEVAKNASEAPNCTKPGVVDLANPDMAKAPDLGKGALSTSCSGTRRMPCKSGAVPEQVPASVTDLMQDIARSIQEMPSQPVKPPAPKLHYNNRGNILKSSFTRNYVGKSPGAYAQAGSAEFVSATSTFDALSSQSCLDPEMQEHNHVEPSGVGSTVPVVEKPCKDECAVWWCKRELLLVMGSCLLLLTVIGTVAPFIILQRNTTDLSMNGKQDAGEETISATPLVPNMTNATLAALGVDGSPQQQAYQWISKDPGWSAFPDWRKQQRFALACFYYTFAMNLAAEKTEAPSYHTSECMWISGGKNCNGRDDRVINFALKYNQQKGGTMFLPSEMLMLPHLESINLGLNKLGTDLESLLQSFFAGSIYSLKEISLMNCELTFSIPSQLGLFTGLTNLDLAANVLTATIPSELGLLSSLSSLQLGDNLLSGSIPEQLGSISTLKTFETDKNYDLLPSLPVGFCSDNQSMKELKTDWCSGTTDCCLR